MTTQTTTREPLLLLVLYSMCTRCIAPSMDTCQLSVQPMQVGTSYVEPLGEA
jgi:hypothetical protein